MLCFTFKLTQLIIPMESKDMEVLTMWTWEVTDHDRRSYIWPKSRVQLGTVLPWKCQVHICTHVPRLSKCSHSFTCSAKAAQFRGSRHFPVCLPLPLSSCLFLWALRIAFWPTEKKHYLKTPYLPALNDQNIPHPATLVHTLLVLLCHNQAHAHVP